MLMTGKQLKVKRWEKAGEKLCRSTIISVIISTVFYKKRLFSEKNTVFDNTNDFTLNMFVFLSIYFESVKLI